MLDRTIPPTIQPASFTFRKPTGRVLRNGIPLHVIEAGGMGAVRIDFVFSAGQFQQARKLQVGGFLRDVLSHIDDEAIREEFELKIEN